MRAFLAVPVTGAALDGGVRLLDRLHAALPRVRWVRSEGLHLTLHFFEDLAEEDAGTVIAAAQRAAATAAPYEAQLGGLGCFPRPGEERVLWVGMQHGAEQTSQLQRAVEDELAAAGFPREPRAFAPHVTLGRPRERFDDAARRRWQGFAEESLPSFAADALLLYRSHMGSGGSRYEEIGRVGLGSVATG